MRDMDYNGWLGIKKRGGFKGDYKKTLKMIICRRNKLYADDKTVVLRFLYCRKKYCKV